MTHERIVTTVHKAKELRPWIERLVRKAQLGLDYNAGQRHLKQTLFTNASIKKLNREIAPRITEQGLTGGFTRIEKLGRRDPDRAEMAMIEIMGNPIQQWEQQQEAQEAEELGRSDFWEWEHKLLKQEQQYFKDHLDKLQDQIENEIEAASTDAPEDDSLRAKSEKKFQKQKTFLLQSLRRAIIEEEIHLKQKGDRRYRALDQKYRSTPVWDMNDLGRNARQAVAN